MAETSAANSVERKVAKKAATRADERAALTVGWTVVWLVASSVDAKAAPLAAQSVDHLALKSVGRWVACSAELWAVPKVEQTVEH